MIEANGLTRYYGTFPALRDATFSIESKSIVGFLGLNGAGKSTLLRILGGLLMPSAGQLRIGGMDALAATDALRRKIGFLPEDPPLYRDMRVGEFLQWVGEVKGRTATQVRSSLPSVLERCQLNAVRDKVIGELSHGFRKRVGIAQAIIHEPDVVILDEPISGLDPQQIVDMRDVVRGLKERATVLISSHILGEVTQTCDRVLVIHDGRIVAEGSERELGKSLGDEERIVLTVRGDEDTVRGVVERVTGHSLESLVALDDQLLRIAVHASAEQREELVRALVHADVGVREVHEAVSELEQIFLELTRHGRKGAESDARKPSIRAPRPEDTNEDARPEVNA